MSAASWIFLPLNPGSGYQFEIVYVTYNIMFHLSMFIHLSMSIHLLICLFAYQSIDTTYSIVNMIFYLFRCCFECV